MCRCSSSSRICKSKALLIGLIILFDASSASYGQSALHKSSNENSGVWKAETPRSQWSLKSNDIYNEYSVDGNTETFNPDCSKAQKKDESEFCQQKRAADIAFDALRISEWQYYVSIFSALVSGAGVLASTLAVIMASRAANAAADAVTAERAYLTYAGSGAGSAVNCTVNGEYIKNGKVVQIVWQDTGRSPAKIVHMVRDFQVLPASADMPHFDPQGEEPFSSSIIGPGDASLSIEFFLNDTEARQVERQDFMLIIYCKIEYNTVWSNAKIYHTEICARVYFTGGQMQREGMSPSSSFSRFMGPQNTFT